MFSRPGDCLGTTGQELVIAWEMIVPPGMMLVVALQCSGANMHACQFCCLDKEALPHQVLLDLLVPCHGPPVQV